MTQKCRTRTGHDGLFFFLRFSKSYSQRRYGIKPLLTTHLLDTIKCISIHYPLCLYVRVYLYFCTCVCVYFFTYVCVCVCACVCLRVRTIIVFNPHIYALFGANAPQRMRSDLSPVFASVVRTIYIQYSKA